MHDPALEQIQFAAAIHLALDLFEAIDMSFGGTVWTNCQIYLIAWMGICFSPSPIPSIPYPANGFPS
jgi:hypothetical protein